MNHPIDWKVLLVEDTFDDQQFLTHLLQHFGADVYLAHDGDDCLEMLPQVNPTLIITDLAMPHRDGWQTLNALRANPQSAHIPVVAVTAYHEPHVAEDAVGAGFDAYFPKPLNPKTFVQRLEDIVNLRLI